MSDLTASREISGAIGVGLCGAVLAGWYGALAGMVIGALVGFVMRAAWDRARRNGLL